MGDCDGLELSSPLVDGAEDADTVNVTIGDVEGTRDNEDVSDASDEAL